MILKYELSSEMMAKLPLSEEEKLYYAVPFDIAGDGSWKQDSYVAVTTKHICLCEKNGEVTCIPIAECEWAKAEAHIGGGLLIISRAGVETKLVHYSAKHLSRYAYIARGINILISGRLEEVESNEYEKVCPKCHKAIPGTHECPHCSKSGGFLRSFLRLLAPYKGRVFGISLLMIGAAVVTLLNPAVQRYLIDDVLKSEAGDIRVAYLCLGAMFFLSVSIVVINILKSYYCTVLGAQIAKDLRAQLFEKIQVLSLIFINDRRPGELMNRIISDTGKIREFMQTTFCNLFTVLFIFIWDMIFMLCINVKLAICAFLFIPVAVWLTGAFRNNIHRRFHLQYKKNDDVSSNLQDVISGMRVVKTYGREKEESEKFDRLAEEYCRVQSRNEIFWAIFFPLLNFIMGMGVFVVITVGGFDILGEKLKPGELFQFITYTQLLYQYISWMSYMPRDIMNLVSSMERINDVLDQEIYVEEGVLAADGKDDGKLCHDIKGDISFRHATFGYKSYQPVLWDINLDIKEGEMIGIVGASGAGKSTMINLLMRLYHIDDGQLLIDGHEIDSLRSDYYHSQLGVVLQETFLFSGTILNNIRFSRPDATMQEVVMAAKLANAHEFICKTPDGYNTYVGEKGHTLSGGERQRIAIARAILNQPRLLILDEATASLDTESEYMIQKALERLTKGRTTFAIAHRLSTLKNADRLLVIDNHRIAEIGSHEELIAKKGIYYRLIKAQLEMQNG